MSEHTAMQGEATLQADVDQLTQELATATARADALDVRCSAAERLAKAAVALHENRGKRGMETVAVHREFTDAITLWHRVDASHHGTRAHDYADAITQLAEARRRVPALEPDDWAHVEREAAHWKQSVPDWLADSITQHLSEYGQVK